MKVILLEDVKKVGKKGEVIEVKSGYATNFLLPQKKAKLATRENIAKLEDEENLKKHNRKLEIEEAKKEKEELEKLTISIYATTGEMGKLFGTITPSEISKELEKQANKKIDKKKISANDAIKTTGSYLIDIRLDREVTAKLRILVKSK